MKTQKMPMLGHFYPDFTLFLQEGMRVIHFWHDDPAGTKGIITHITQKFFTVKEDSGREKKCWNHEYYQFIINEG